ncbi:MAG TPA: D-alanyl-D-alanine carboxypeptidase/D-alanyl-D-alanine-endopeptidase [Vicinamibacterales bacterium]|nr:D-alanyl-D-alanine carboxypeptidase/D-alanyl-D-alanine-endopeptidase [Vicinamibacterales bacterium]
MQRAPRQAAEARRHGSFGIIRTSASPRLRRSVHLWLFLVAAGCARHAAPIRTPTPPALAPVQQLEHDLTAITQRPGVQRGTWGVAVASIDRGDRLFELRPRALLVPASTAKLVSVAAAADAVGWDYRYATTLEAGGPIVDGVLHGDLMVSGSGDPSIGGRGGDDLTSWIDALRGLGIRRIDGRIIGDDDAIDEPRAGFAWAWDDLGYQTGALFGALNYAENRMTVRITPGAAEGEPTTIFVEPWAIDRPLKDRALTGAAASSQLLWPEQRPGEPVLTLAGSIPVGARPATLLVSAGNPTLWFASVLRHRLIDAGILVSGNAVDIDDVQVDRTSFTTIFTYRSHPLAEIVRPLLKDSINLYAEAMLRLNTAPGVFPTNDAALDALKQRLARWNVPAEGEQLVDGSGLSRRDVIAPDTLVAILTRMHDASDTSPWMTALPIAGVDGSLANRMKGTPAEGNVRAKTGTMSNIRSLAGYVTTRDGEHLAFAIMLNDFEGTGAAAVQAIDAMAIRLAEFSRK